VLDTGNPWGLSCYGGNYQVFGNPDSGDYPQPNMQGQAKITGSIPDGTSTTVLFAEKYSRCNNYATLWGHGNWESAWMAMFAYGNRAGTTGYTSQYNWGPPGKVGPTSKFQIMPDPYQTACLTNLAQSPHSVINVALADGSVRAVSGAVSGDTWWKAVTPNGGEVLGSDW